jgi:HEAT repeat protein
MLNADTNLRSLLSKYDKARSDDARSKIICQLIQCDPEITMKLCRTDSVAPAVRRRFRAAWIMAELGYPKRLFLHERQKLLQQMLASDESSAVRSRAAHSLGVLGTARALNVLKQYFADKDPHVRREVASYLGISKQIWASRILMRVACDPDENVREMAAFSLGASNRRLSSGMRKTLFKLAKDTNERVRHEAIRALISKGETTAVDLLLNELENYGVDIELQGAVQELRFLADGV